MMKTVLAFMISLAACAEETPRFSVADCVRFETDRHGHTNEEAQSMCVAERTRRDGIAAREGTQSFSMTDCLREQTARYHDPDSERAKDGAKRECREEQRQAMVASRNATDAELSHTSDGALAVVAAIAVGAAAVAQSPAASPPSGNSASVGGCYQLRPICAPGAHPICLCESDISLTCGWLCGSLR